MIGVALSDLHLGYTGPGRTINGRAGREIDVEIALGHAVDRIVDAQPDLVTIAGDCFHSVRPSFHAVKAFQQAVRRIVNETKAHLVVIPGNHESPRTASALSPNIVIAGASDRVHYVDEVKTIILTVASGERVAVTCAPFAALGPDVSYALEPFKGVDANVLVIHASVKTSAIPNALPYFYGNEGIDIGREADRWEAICCGDYHDFQRLHPTALAFFSGAIERTSSNIWQEKSGKGIVRYDTSTGEMELLEIPTRPVIDWTLTVDATAFGINSALEYWLGPIAHVAHVADSILRINAECPRSERDQIDWRLVRELKTKCFFFNLDIDWLESDSNELPTGVAGRRSLRDDAELFFSGESVAVQTLAYYYLGIDKAAA